MTEVVVEVLLLRSLLNVAVETSRAIGYADLGAKDECRASFEHERRLDDDLSHRTHVKSFGDLPYQARQLSVFYTRKKPLGYLG